MRQTKIILLTCWIYNFLHKDVFTSFVTIDGPNHVRLGEPIVVNCSAVSSPIGKNAEFLINNKSHTNLVSRNNRCYSGDTGRYCDLNVCQCSNDGRRFQLLIKQDEKNKFVEISCVMKFFEDGRLIPKRDELIVQNVDVKGPFIYTEPAQPFTAGTIAHLKCKVVSPVRNISITWNCFQIIVQCQHRENETILISKAILDVKSDYRGKYCSCLAFSGNLRLSTNLKLDVFDLPMLKVVGERECNTTSLLLLSCLLSADVNQYGFNDWIHTINDVFIRRLKGKRHNNTSALIINSCNYQDSGDYTCTAWNRYSAGIFSTNISATVSVNGPPTIVDVQIYKDEETIISLVLYSMSSISKMEWLVNGRLIGNDSSFYVSSSKYKIFINIYGISVRRPGYMFNLTIKDNTPGKYEIFFGNNFGETRRQITINAHEKDFYLGTVTWVLIVISVFFLTCLFGILSSNRGNQAGAFNWHICIERKIYLAAPAAEVTIQTYDTTNPHYDEIIPDDDYELPAPVMNTSTNDEDIYPYIEPIY